MASNQQLDNQNNLADHVRAYPSILAACLKSKDTSPARLYLLLQALDPAGRGMFDVDQIRATFTDKKLNSYLWCWRRMRQILTAGEGVFWRRHTAGRLWLNSPSRVAQALRVEHVSGAPVAIPIDALLAGKHVAASFFKSAWHASRENANPISRKTMHKLIGVAPSTQRLYDKTANVTRQTNIAIYPEACDPESEQAAVWDCLQRHGNTFRYVDHIGQLGRRGATYPAANMPSSYHTELLTLPRGRTRKINQNIHLVDNGPRGKSEEIERVYYEDGAAACDSYNRNPDQTIYYKLKPVYRVTAARPARIGGAMAWACIEGQR